MSTEDVPIPNTYPPGVHAEREKFSTIEIPNTVLWHNDAIDAPFLFEDGKPSPLGLFLALGSTLKLKLKQGLDVAIRSSAHRRSVDLPPVYFKAKDGQVLRDVDVKGSGYSVEALPEGWGGKIGREEDVRGLMDLESAMHDAAMAETLTKLGVRTHRTLATIRLDALPQYEDNQMVKLVPYKRLQSKKWEKRVKIPKEFVPVVQIRAFGTKTRILDLTSFPYGFEKRRKEVEDTIALVKREAGDAVTDVTSYIEWFAKKLGTNLGKMHANGYIHTYVSPHNITIDGGLTDFDSTRRVDTHRIDFQSMWLKDIANAQTALARLHRIMVETFLEERIPEYFDLIEIVQIAHAAEMRAKEKTD